MKITISIPDQVFQAAEQFAHRLGISRSELYSKAISEYLEKHALTITDILNCVYSGEKSSLDLIAQKLQSKSLLNDE